MLRVPGHNMYSITEDGRVWSHHKDRFIRTTVRKSKHGLPYGYVGLLISSQPKRYKFYYVHQLVMLTYLGDCPGGMEVDHIDLDPSNNHISNLRYVTHKQNVETRRHSNQYLISR